LVGTGMVFYGVYGYQGFGSWMGYVVRMQRKYVLDT
jgi:hypothetical protein